MSDENAPLDPTDLPPDVQAGLELVREVMPEGTEMRVLGVDPLGLLKEAMTAVTPLQVMDVFMKLCASACVDHAVECDAHDDEEHWSMWFDELDRIITAIKDTLYPQFLETVERRRFELSVQSDLDSL
jgi:hypothetical protein